MKALAIGVLTAVLLGTTRERHRTAEPTVQPFLKDLRWVAQDVSAFMVLEENYESV